VPDHLDAETEDPSPEDLARWGEDATEWDVELAPLHRPTWWRWVALAVVVALVLATPVAYAWSILSR